MPASTPKIEALPELRDIERLAEELKTYGDVGVEGYISAERLELPVYSFCLGNPDPKSPALVMVGGVHGLERIGTRVINAYMHTVAHLLTWDHGIHHFLERGRLIFYPLVNPGGMLMHMRSNPAGIDLMRNAPVEAQNPKYMMVAGHRVSHRLPWYRGEVGQPLAEENQLLLEFLKREVWQAERAIVLDVHSGFGLRDRFWFPWAKAHEPFPHIAEAYALRRLLSTTYPRHIYKFEPQSRQYTTHGDIWDYIYDLHLREQGTERLMIPFCLELGSWNWVRKNPRQMLNLLGIFNPIIYHREQRTLRRHITLFEFLFKAVVSARQWADLDKDQKAAFRRRASLKWFRTP